MYRVYLYYENSSLENLEIYRAEHVKWCDAEEEKEEEWEDEEETNFYISG